MIQKAFDFLSSLKLTITCLAAAIVLVFAGTLAQVNFGIHIVQERYFQSLFVWWPPEGGGFKFPVFPGGHLIGGILLVNLVAAHARRFQWGWKKLGIHLTHIGLIVMLAGGLLTDLFAVESHMRLAIGETRNYSEDQRTAELAIIDTSGEEFDQVTAIPAKVLARGGEIDHKSLPFRVVVRNYFQNSRLHMAGDHGGRLKPLATKGLGAQVAVQPVPRATASDQRDVVAAVVELIPKEAGAESLGSWLVSEALGAPQTFVAAGRSWRLELRPGRYYKPYSVTLQKFTHERYPGTEIPKNFASRVTLIDPERSVNRDVLIYMNNPLRYRGDTLYQSGFERGDTASVLQVVRNPGFATPYVACVIVGVGLLVQFGFHLVSFARRRRRATALAMA